MDNNVVIEAKNLTKTYTLYSQPMDRLKEVFHPFRKKYHKDFTAINDISFAIKQGQTVGIIGKNGSGKSTLLKILTGVLTATSGEMSVQGKIAALLELGAGFNPELTGIENIYLNGALMGFTNVEMESRLKGIVDFADIGDFVFQPVKTYSSGMFARLAFAVAINVEPDILIIDEALSVGDIYFQSKCFERFNYFRKNGKTVLFVTHSLDLVVQHCDLAFHLEKGIIVDSGKPSFVVNQYKRKLVVDGSEMINTIEANNTAEVIDTVTTDSTVVADSTIAAQSATEAQGTMAVSCANEASSPVEVSCPVEMSKTEKETGVRPYEYGTQNIRIETSGCYNQADEKIEVCESGDSVKIKMIVQCRKSVDRVIFAFALKRPDGFEILGSNTEYEGLDYYSLQEGKRYEVIFEAQIMVNPCPLLLSFGCVTKLEDGNLVIHHRLYDASHLHVTTRKPTTGVLKVPINVFTKEL